MQHFKYPPNILISNTILHMFLYVENVRNLKYFFATWKVFQKCVSMEITNDKQLHSGNVMIVSKLLRGQI